MHWLDKLFLLRGYGHTRNRNRTQVYILAKGDCLVCLFKTKLFLERLGGSVG